MKAELINWPVLLTTALASGLLLAGLARAAVPGDAADPPSTAAENAAPASPQQAEPAPQPQRDTITREGVKVEFTLTPSGGKAPQGELLEDQFAEIAFRITSAETGEPLRGVYPGAWVDLTQTADGETKGTSLECKTRVGQYLQGMVGMRPMIDLNSYYVMAMNRDASISVIDPVVGITGITSLYTSIRLKRPGADWAKTSSEKWSYVSMPRAGEIALVNLDTFKVEANIAAGETPTRVALQPDEKYLWVGNDAKAGERGGVSVIDTRERKRIATIPTGAGHHEIAFSDDGRYTFVSNRDSGTVSVIDIEKLEKVRDIETGGVPIALAVSPLSQSLYVADGKTGIISVVKDDSLEIIGRIEAKAGLGPMRFSEDGRWGVAVNPVADEVYVIDAATNHLAHTVSVAGKPFQVNVSPAFAYIRRLESERVSMINLTEIAKGGKPVVSYFAAGSLPPSQSEDISIADPIVPAANEAAVLVVSPADATVYYYMEGMNAPMGAFRNYGHKPRAVQIANRALQEKEPGVYAATVRAPAAGTFEVAFLNEAPRFLHCFAFEVRPNPLVKHAQKPLAVDFLLGKNRVIAGKELTLRFRLSDPATGMPRTDVEDVRVAYFRAPNFGRAVVPARHVSEGIYESTLAFRAAGAYYVYVGAPSENVRYEDLNYLTLTAVREKGP